MGMAEPVGGEHASAYGTPAHSIPMVSGGHGSIHEPEIKSGIAGIPIDAEKSAARSREPISSPDLIAKATAADARLLGSRRTSRTPSIERSAETEERPKSVAAITKAIHQLDERVEDIEVAKFEADRAASAEKRHLEKKIIKHSERLEEVVQQLALLGDTREEQIAKEFSDLAASMHEKDAIVERRSEQQRNQLAMLQAGHEPPSSSRSKQCSGVQRPTQPTQKSPSSSSRPRSKRCRRRRAPSRSAATSARTSASICSADTPTTTTAFAPTAALLRPERRQQIGEQEGDQALLRRPLQGPQLSSRRASSPAQGPRANHMARGGNAAIETCATCSPVSEPPLCSHPVLFTPRPVHTQACSHLTISRKTCLQKTN